MLAQSCKHGTRLIVGGDGFRLEPPRPHRRGHHPDDEAPRRERTRPAQLSSPQPAAQPPHVGDDPPRPRPGRQPGRKPQPRPASAEPGDRPRRNAGLAAKLDQRNLRPHMEGEFAQLSDQGFRDRHDGVPAPGVPDPKPRRSIAETFEPVTLWGNVARIFSGEPGASATGVLRREDKLRSLMLPARLASRDHQSCEASEDTAVGTQANSVVSCLRVPRLCQPCGCFAGRAFL